MQISTLRAKIRADLKRDGFGFYPRLLAELVTTQVANIVGSLANLSQLLPESAIPVVQTLVPREANQFGLNRYSGNYGLAEFPLHSDLAHWAVPPRYFMLRCIVGSNDVFTHVLSWASIVDRIECLFQLCPPGRFSLHLTREGVCKRAGGEVCELRL